MVVFGFDAESDLIGAAVGHMYYFIADILPKIPETHGLELLKPPRLLVRLCEWLRVHDPENMGDDLFRGGVGWIFSDEADEQ